MKIKRSAAKPYEGASPFIFMSYCHSDRRFVYPIIERLTRLGYRIWYDEGINPGSEWNEVIAEHLSRSSLCIAFVTDNAVASHNCRREISFALLKNKPLLSLFLKETILTPGIEMQLSANQQVFIDAHRDVDECLQKIVSMPEFGPCMGEPSSAVVIRPPSYYDQADPEGEQTINTCDEWFGLKQPVADSLTRQTRQYVLLRKTTGKQIRLDNATLYIGRKADGIHNCYKIPENPEISRYHCTISKNADGYWVTDGFPGLNPNSKNGTFVNGIRLQPNESKQLDLGDEIRASSEVFIFQETTLGGE